MDEMARGATKVKKKERTGEKKETKKKKRNEK